MTDFSANNTGNTLFPIFLKLDQLHTLIVGGGNVGLEKLEAVIGNAPAARITLVAAEIRRPEILEIAAHHANLEVITRDFALTDLDGKDVVILATDRRDLHETIKAETRRRHLLTNVADTPDLCDFYLCSIVKRGDLKIGVSTNGKSPTLAKRMREYLSDTLPATDEVQTLLDNLKAVRDRLGGDFDYKVRKLNEITSSWLNESAAGPAAPETEKT